jgi:hypothetical protein
MIIVYIRYTHLSSVLPLTFGVHPSLIALPVTLIVFLIFAYVGQKPTLEQMRLVEKMSKPLKTSSPETAENSSN